MKIKETYKNISSKIRERKKLIVIISLIFTILFALYNRIIGAINKSLWHESISIYYFILVLIKSIILIYISKSKNRSKDKIIFYLTKTLLFLLNISLIIPIVLMILNKRIVKISFIFSIVIALYVTIKTTKSIVLFIKRRKEKDVLLKELKVIDLIDSVISILTLQNTLISINSNEISLELHYITFISSFLGLIFNLYLIINLKIYRKSIHKK